MDHYDEDTGRPDAIDVRVTVTNQGIGIHLDGYGDIVTDDAESEPIWIEYYNGHPKLFVWGNINVDDCTDSITLEGAAISNRKREAWQNGERVE